MTCAEPTLWTDFSDFSIADAFDTKLPEKIVDTLEEQDCYICGYGNDDEWVELEFYSPAGEAFNFVVEVEDFPKKLHEFALSFDVDEHVELWIPSHGEGGCPSTICELVEDAEAIQTRLFALANAVAVA